MHKLNRTVTALGMAILFTGSLALVGCSSSPSEEELKQLQDLKSEVAALQRDISAKEADKAALEKEVAEKNAKMKKCQDDQVVVKQRLANQ
jgi:outer membrane murein-binding lipoprotein Lpp